MGNARSRYEETNWAEASGQGLKSAAGTVDGSAPTNTHTQIIVQQIGGAVQTLQSLPVLRNINPVREYEALDTSTGKPIFQTKKVDTLEMGFDLVPAVEAESTLPKLRIDSTFSNRNWHIFQVGTPVFEGQRPMPKPSEKCGEELYRKAIVVFSKGTEHTAAVYMFENTESEDHEDELDQPLIQVDRCTPPDLVGKVTDQWHFQTSQKKITTTAEEEEEEAPLVGYWKRDTLCVPGKDKMMMDLAKDSDLALHFILVVIATIERMSIKAEYSG